jgi:glutathione S-transferase
METQLDKTPYLAGNAISVADIALYVYTQDAGIAGYDTARFPAVMRWLDRIRAEPGYVGMEWKPA